MSSWRVRWKCSLETVAVCYSIAAITTVTWSITRPSSFLYKLWETIVRTVWDDFVSITAGTSSVTVLQTASGSATSATSWKRPMTSVDNTSRWRQPSSSHLHEIDFLPSQKLEERLDCVSKTLDSGQEKRSSEVANRHRRKCRYRIATYRTSSGVYSWPVSEPFRIIKRG